MMHCKLARNASRQHKKRHWISLESNAVLRKKPSAADKKKNFANLNKVSVNVPYLARVLKPRRNDVPTRKRFFFTSPRPVDT